MRRVLAWAGGMPWRFMSRREPTRGYVMHPKILMAVAAVSQSEDGVCLHIIFHANEHSGYADVA